MSKITEQHKISILKTLIKKSKKLMLSKESANKAEEYIFKYLSDTIEESIKEAEKQNQ